MTGVLTYKRGLSLSAAVAHAERLGCDVLYARKSPNARAIVDVHMTLRVANRVAFAVLRGELQFSRNSDQLQSAS